MKAYIVRGQHWNVPGVPTTVHLDSAGAENAARVLVNSLVADEPELRAEEPHLAVGDDWRAALRRVQEWRIVTQGDASVLDDLLAHPLGETVIPGHLADESRCDVWIEEHDVALGPDGPWAHPVPLETMEAYRALAMEVMEAEENNWDFAHLLAPFAERCLNLDPPSDGKPQAVGLKAGIMDHLKVTLESTPGVEPDKVVLFKGGVLPALEPEPQVIFTYDAGHEPRMNGPTVAEAARAMIDAYGGNVPDWIMAEVAAVERAITRDERAA